MTSLPSWNEHWEDYISAFLMIIILAMVAHKWLTNREPPRLTPEEENVPGLPFYTDPSLWRQLGFLTIILPSTVLVPLIFAGGTGIILSIIGCGLALAIFVGLGAQAAQEKWLSDDKLERQKNVIAARQKQQEQEEQDRRAAELRQLEEENARYAHLGLPDANPADITETARRLAEELRRS